MIGCSKGNGVRDFPSKSLHTFKLCNCCSYLPRPFSSTPCPMSWYLYSYKPYIEFRKEKISKVTCNLGR